MNIVKRPVVFIIKKRMSSTTLSVTPLIVNNANVVSEIISQTSQQLNHPVQLVAVSKTKPSSEIQILYDAGYRHFGENYTQELTEKAANLPSDIKWHFIGHLQSSKANRLVKDVPNLNVVETVDSVKLATKLNSAVELAKWDRKLDIYIQVDTSGEDSKSGVGTIEELDELAKHVINECKNLKLKGLMTIGAPGDLSCFDKLVLHRRTLCLAIGMETNDLELSMGMSGDYEEAIKRGSTSVRVGSTIFGARLYPKVQATESIETATTVDSV